MKIKKVDEKPMVIHTKKKQSFIHMNQRKLPSRLPTSIRLTEVRRLWATKRNAASDRYYESIRRRSDDVQKISLNTGWTEKSIKQIKSHVFYDSHIKYENELGLLDSDYNMAVAWQRLINGEYEKRDILLLKHEYLESIVEKKYNITNKEAHDIVTKKHNWEQILNNEKGEFGEDVRLDDLIKKER